MIQLPVYSPLAWAVYDLKKTRTAKNATEQSLLRVASCAAEAGRRAAADLQSETGLTNPYELIQKLNINFEWSDIHSMSFS